METLAVGDPFYIFIIHPDIVNRAVLIQHFASLHDQNHFLSGGQTRKQEVEEDGNKKVEIGLIHCVDGQRRESLRYNRRGVYPVRTTFGDQLFFIALKIRYY
jgi:hypothetical protein